MIGRIGVIASSIVTSPIPTSGLKLWADAADFTSAGALSQWSDKSGNNNHLIQGTGASQPSSVLNVLNGKPIVRFDGIDDFFNLTTAISSVGDFEQFIVMKRTTAITQGIGLGTTSASGPYPTLQYLDGSVYISRGTGYSHIALSTTQWNYWSGRIESDVRKLRRNASELGLTSVVSARTAIDFTMLGKWASGNHSGDIAEVIFYNRVLTTSERTQVESYITNKWGSFPS